MLRYLLATLVTVGVPVCLSAQCPSTRSPQRQSFVPPAPYLAATHARDFWYCSNSLWTRVGDDFQVADGERRISAKLVYWRVGFDSQKETDPELAVVARRLDGPAPLVWAEHASAVRFPQSDGPASLAMMTGISFPTAGCWEIAANYKGQMLSYIVSVKP
jgi:hypothetical protein